MRQSMSIDQKEIYNQEHPPISKQDMEELGFIEEESEIPSAGFCLTKVMIHPMLGRHFYFELDELPSKDSLIPLIFNEGTRVGEENKEYELRKALGLNK